MAPESNRCPPTTTLEATLITPAFAGWPLSAICPVKAFSGSSYPLVHLLPVRHAWGSLAKSL